jgi:glycosyltransferase involved in cell wall biosynthesis
MDCDMNTDTAISVIVPSFNPGEYMKPAVLSAITQFSDSDELVIHDGGSTDGTIAYLESVQATEPRVKVSVERDDGQSDALNRALARTSNDWILWLNADDVVLPGALQSLRDAITEHPDANLIVGGHQLIRADGSIIDHFKGSTLDVKRMINRGCAAFSGSILMKRDLLNDIGGFETDLHTTMDLSLQFRLADYGLNQVLIPAEIAGFRIHGTSKTSNMWPTFVKEAHAVRLRYATTPGQKISTYLGSTLYWAMWPTWNVRHTPAYRRWRKRVVKASTAIAGVKSR